MTSDNLSILPHIEHVVFDWNGTLIDDIDLAVLSVNRCGERFGVPPVTRERYRALFGFPIADFYAALGFDFSTTPFAMIVRHYLESFDPQVAECKLHEGALDLLDAARVAGVGVSILSASHRDILLDTLDAKGLRGRFAQIVGLSDNRATSKVVEAAQLQQTLNRPPERTLYVGDTLHDYEVSRSIGWQTVLVSTGHQDVQRLRGSGARVCAGLADLLAQLAPAWRTRDDERSARNG
ncbi:MULTISPECIES: HAD family hydrolase [unclassified Burkholderia]|uniref:HAD family hydrolase n=1 Tax=unclassified Burkholderia TaxID=2613784 RepID=UPI000759ADE4|nr:MULTISPECIES: HAD family hydrolase [unclassified Burkholderia]KVN07013.1 phosphoglycolate phosphatase [Burkholderia sp. MSMB1552]KWZ49491.1 phosphoglycolate phosphatase [Burkholderia sp. MSMB1588]